MASTSAQAAQHKGARGRRSLDPARRLELERARLTFQSGPALSKVSSDHHSSVAKNRGPGGMLPVLPPWQAAPKDLFTATPGVDQCERHPQCTRGSRHHGKGGKCSIDPEKPMSFVALRFEATMTTNEEALVQCVEVSDEGGPPPLSFAAKRGPMTTATTATTISSRPSAPKGVGGATSEDPPTRCKLNRLCVRGFQHGGQGGRCMFAWEQVAPTPTPAKPLAPAPQPTSQSQRVPGDPEPALDAVTKMSGGDNSNVNRAVSGAPEGAEDQCEKHPGCCRGFRHHGKGGKCSIGPPRKRKSKKGCGAGDTGGVGDTDDDQGGADRDCSQLV